MRIYRTLRQPTMWLTAAVLLAATPALAATRTLDVEILGTTDVHGHIYPTNYFHDKGDEPLGLARVYSLVKQRRATHAHTLLVDSGDSLQGTPLTYYSARIGTAAPNPMVAAYNMMGYNAFTMGNHEYNYGIPYIMKARAEAQYPFLSGNIYKPGTNIPVFQPYIIENIGGAKIAIMGFTTPGIKVWDRHNVEGKEEFRDILESAKRWIPEVKALGADAIVVTIHSGLGEPYDETYGGYAEGAAPPENVCAKLADAFPDDITAIMLGHSHQNLPKLLHHGVVLTQAGKWGDHLAVVDLHFEQKDGHWKVTSKDSTTLATKGVPPAPELLAVARRAHNNTMAYVNSIIGVSTGEWVAKHARTEDSAIMDFINEVQMAKTGADLSAASVFNSHAFLPKGKITVADIASLYVYENTLTKIEITGKQLKGYLENSASYYAPYKRGAKIFDDKQPAYNHDMVSGVAYTIDVTKPVGQRIGGMVFKGKPVTDAQKFTMALNSYRQNGGGGYTMIKNAPIKQAIYTEIRDIMIDYVKQKHVISPDKTVAHNWKLIPAGVVAADGEHYQ